jgi:hypothetical protein
MRVELPRLLAVLAHEVRGPLGIIQGYLRLLLQRHEADADTPMLKAMLDATGRLSQLGRQASEASSWDTTTDRVVSPLPVETLASQLSQKISADRATIDLSGARDQLIATMDAGALVSAIGTVIDAVARDCGGTVVVTAPAGGRHGTDHVVLQVGSATPVAEGQPRPSGSPARPLFERGGQGLALVFASFVFDTHGATVAGPDEAGNFSIVLQKDRGSR